MWYLLVLVSCISELCCAQVKEGKTPNIILIFPDQLRSDYVGANGGKWAYTPNMDRLANEGAVFTRSYSATPTCLPARAALLTGKKPWKHGLLAYAPIATKYNNEMPQLLREAGYYTFATGKLHYKPIGCGPLNVELGAIDNTKFMHGFHEITLCEGWGHPQNAYNKWFKEKAPAKNIDGTGLGATDHRPGIYPYREELHPTTWTANQAIDFIRDYDRTAPYFLKVAFHRPHPPFDPPKRWLDFYKDKAIPSAAVGDWATEKYGGFNKIPEPGEQQTSPRGNYGDGIVRKSREAYLASISFLDEQIGKIITALEEQGELENTLIVVSSDHGDMMGDHHLWRKSYPYEGSSGVPMIVRWPESIGIPAERGQVIENLVELRDVLPTFLEVAQVAPPPDLDGLSLLNLIRGERNNWRKILDLEHGTCYWPENNWTGLTDAKFKYIYFATTGEEQLFDLEQDPQEMFDLAKKKEYKDSLQKWRQKMVDHLAERGEPWVVNGDLGIRTGEIRFSPNYPKLYYPKEMVTKY